MGPTRENLAPRCGTGHPAKADQTAQVHPNQRIADLVQIGRAKAIGETDALVELSVDSSSRLNVSAITCD